MIDPPTYGLPIPDSAHLIFIKRAKTGDYYLSTLLQRNVVFQFDHCCYYFYGSAK